MRETEYLGYGVERQDEKAVSKICWYSRSTGRWGGNAFAWL